MQSLKPLNPKHKTTEMLKSLSPYACAAKSLFSAKTSAKRLNGVKQNQCNILRNTLILIIFKGRLAPIGPTKFEAKPLPAGSFKPTQEEV